MFKDGVYIPDRLFGEDELVGFMMVYGRRDKEICTMLSEDSSDDREEGEYATY